MGYLRNVKNTMRLITLLGMKMSKERDLLQALILHGIGVDYE